MKAALPILWMRHAEVTTGRCNSSMDPGQDIPDNQILFRGDEGFIGTSTAYRRDGLLTMVCRFQFCFASSSSFPAFGRSRGQIKAFLASVNTEASQVTLSCRIPRVTHIRLSDAPPCMHRDSS